MILLFSLIFFTLMVRYYRRRFRPYSSKSRWEAETKSVAIKAIMGAQGSTATLITASEVKGGWRTIKNITVSCSVPYSFRWAIVYVPQGTEVGALAQDPVPEAGGGSVVDLYKPNQYVMAAGTYDSGAGPNRIFCPLARKLGSGDAIYLIVRGADNGPLNIMAIVRYVIKYN